MFYIIRKLYEFVVDAIITKSLLGFKISFIFNKFNDKFTIKYANSLIINHLLFLIMGLPGSVNKYLVVIF